MGDQQRILAVVRFAILLSIFVWSDQAGSLWTIDLYKHSSEDQLLCCDDCHASNYRQCSVVLFSRRDLLEIVPGKMLQHPVRDEAKCIEPRVFKARVD